MSQNPRFPPHQPRVPLSTYTFIVAPLVLASFLEGPEASAQARQQNERSLFVSVVDANDAPVAGLPLEQFVVEEDGVEREIITAEPARTPMQLALLVDTSDAAAFGLSDVRTGLETLVSNLHQNENEIALITFGGPPRIIVESTSRLNRLQEGIRRVFTSSGDAAYLLDALVETARGFERRRSQRPIVVIITSQGVDYSRYAAADALRSLEAAGAMTHIFVLMNRGTPQGPISLDRNIGLNGDTSYQRDRALAQIPRATGGQQRDLFSSSALSRALHQLTLRLTSQYELVYSRPASLLPPETISVRMQREDMKAFAIQTRLGRNGTQR